MLFDEKNAAIARAIVNLGQNLGVTVIAEGVETDAQWQFLIENGCHSFQGYLFGHPTEM
jgi:EAL domain-containing protein (putative c-di-GMP-specific phosphodiesterase class I)